MKIPVGIFAEPKVLLAKIIAETHAWRAWTQTAGETLPHRRIFYSMLRAEDFGKYRPFCVLEWERWNSSTIAGGSRNVVWPDSSNGIRLTFQATDDSGASPGREESDLLRDAEVYFENRVGAVIEQMLDLAAVNDRLAITGVEMRQPCVRNPVEEAAAVGSYIWSSFIVRFQ